MMNMLKKILSIAMVLSLVFAVAAADEITDVVITDDLYAEAVDGESSILAPCGTSCSHDEYEMIGDPADVEPTIMRSDDVYHKSAKVMTAICLKASCSKKITVYVNTRYIPHTLTNNGDAHVEGKSIHRYNQKCDACGFTTYYEMRCIDCE